MEVKSVFENWVKCGSKSINSFTLSNHYSTLFEDSDGGFDYMFDVVGLSEVDLINSTNPKVEEVVNQIDGGMKSISELIEEFIKSNLLSETDIEDVEVSLRDLKQNITNTYSDILEDLMELKDVTI